MDIRLAEGRLWRGLSCEYIAATSALRGLELEFTTDPYVISSLSDASGTEGMVPVRGMGCGRVVRSLVRLEVADSATTTPLSCADEDLDCSFVETTEGGRDSSRTDWGREDRCLERVERATDSSRTDSACDERWLDRVELRGIDSSRTDSGREDRCLELADRATDSSRTEASLSLLCLDFLDTDSSLADASLSLVCLDFLDTVDAGGTELSRTDCGRDDRSLARDEVRATELSLDFSS